MKDRMGDVTMLTIFKKANYFIIFVMINVQQ